MTVAAESKLAVTVVLPCSEVSVWQSELLTNLDCADHLQLTVAVLADGELAHSCEPWAFRMWRQFDLNTFRNKLPNGCSSEDPVGKDVLQNLNGSRIKSGLSRATLDDLFDERSPDVLVWLVRQRPRASYCGVAKFGTWMLPNAQAHSTGYRELVQKIPVTACMLTTAAAVDDDARVLSTAFSRTDSLSLCRSLVAVRAKDQTLLMTMLKRVFDDGAIPQQKNLAAGEIRPPTYPGLMGLAFGLVRLYGRYARSLVTRRFFYSQWQITYRRGGDRLSQEGMTSFAPDHRGFWADPFVAEWQGQTAMFFEEMPEGEVRGKIVVSQFGDNGVPGLPQTIISRGYHLSYPFLFEYDGELFMTPESGEANKVEAYRCVEFPSKWEPCATLLNGVTAYDPTLIEHEGRWWMFVSVQHDGNSSDDELHLFYAADPFSDWTSHPRNPVNCDVRSARPGGALYRRDGELFRPAQDCSVRYGYALSIQKILRMTPEEYEEEEVGRILPNWSPGSWGTHTVNQAAGITVYDCIARRRK